MISHARLYYLHATLSEWTKSKDLSSFDPRALAAYESAFTDKTIAASTADYRADWTIDRFQDQTDLNRGLRIASPTLVLWGSDEFPDDTQVVSALQRIAPDLTACPLDCGHFSPEEAAGPVLHALRTFFARSVIPDV